MENKFERGNIYKIINTIDDTYYIGSTCQNLSERLSGHKTDARKDYFLKVKFINI